ncbi:ADP-ribose pyrophosphatase, mitochondrial isoform X3 [Dermacentor andersoni]|uniref:ADP-ribose pyrophosphatase, mitochondrial isoform X3 n=1 Tax=Dermacentor andersoni TaxID=34620 RepID=UPI0024163DB0|nr:ADP-ribose pyrophosphatase, mitochondrial-like isoform X3 [Dermacentor andersoni]
MRTQNFLKVSFCFSALLPKTMRVHAKCRGATYPGTDVQRLYVPENKVPWTVEWPDYKPPEFSIPALSSKPWADPELGWKRDAEGVKVINQCSQLPVLQFVAIARRDSGEWAIPGGMVDPGELVNATLRREFYEEAMNSLSLSEKDKRSLERSLESFFSKGVEVYKGYVDDPRNTDNAWMETVAYNFHDESGDVTGKFSLEAGDDAAKVKWTDISKELCLYASHSDFVHKVVQRLNAHW